MHVDMLSHYCTLDAKHSALKAGDMVFLKTPDLGIYFITVILCK